MKTFFQRAFAFLVLGLLSVNSSGRCNADIATGWDIGEQAPDFDALYLDENSGLEAPTTLHAESGADFYVLSTCATWCNPCQLFAQQSESMQQVLAAQGIDVQIYDLVFQNNFGEEPDADLIQAWIDNVWTSDSENVWFGGMISESLEGNVTHEIFTAIGGGGSIGIPAIVIMDRNFVVQDLQEGFDRARIESSIRNAAVPEPSGFALLVTATIGVLFNRRRPATTK